MRADVVLPHPGGYQPNATRFVPTEHRPNATCSTICTLCHSILHSNSGDALSEVITFYLLMLGCCTDGRRVASSITPFTLAL